MGCVPMPGRVTQCFLCNAIEVAGLGFTEMNLRRHLPKDVDLKAVQIAAARSQLLQRRGETPRVAYWKQAARQRASVLDGSVHHIRDLLDRLRRIGKALLHPARKP